MREEEGTDPARLLELCRVIFVPMEKVWILFICLLRVLKAQHHICLPDLPRIECDMMSETDCVAVGCCWSLTEKQPSCFFSRPKYVVASSTETKSGMKLTLEISGGDGAAAKDQVAAPLSPLDVEVIRESETRLHVRIDDPNNQRYEIPQMICRRYTNETLFNSTSLQFLFADKFLTIGTSLPPDYNLYGIGEHKDTFKLRSNHRYTLWNSDVPPTNMGLNLYGSHPFYLEMRGGKAHGVFLRSSNGMDILLDNTSLTYRVTGGILDFYFFVGELGQPDEVIHSYHDVIGRPAMPPYWSLGFHQSRQGYPNLQAVKEVVGNFTEAKIPLDTVWVDIDYMNKYRDFTVDPSNFPADEFKQFISDLHKNGRHLVLVLDPAICRDDNYQPYQSGLQSDVFIKDRKDKVFLGKSWPGLSVYPDFMNPNCTLYWQKQLSTFMELVPLSGVATDMNEPSNFCDGACSQEGDNGPPLNMSLSPYSINNQGRFLPLNVKTLDVDCKQYGHHILLNTHNLYGLTESIATREALLSINKYKRPFIISRSTFAGSGAHASHWLGDNTASSEDMHYSIPGILNFQMFGMPQVGADICGFNGDSTEELCSRWMSLGAFYPFSRNHNAWNSNAQEPYRWSSVGNISRKYLSIRYSLLPYYYTLFYKAIHNSSITYTLLPSAMVVKPLFFEFRDDRNSLSIDQQFLIGSSLLISPQLELGDSGKVLDVYLPPARWYDWYTYTIVSETGGVTISEETPMDHLPIHVRGGSIIPVQEPGLTTTASRKNPYSLLVFLDVPGVSEVFGDLYLDDGITESTKDYTYVLYSCQGQQLNAYVHGTGYVSKNHLPSLMNVTVIGLSNPPTVVSLDGKPQKFTFSYIGKSLVLYVTGLNVTMDTNFTLDWI